MFGSVQVPLLDKYVLAVNNFIVENFFRRTLTYYQLPLHTLRITKLLPMMMLRDHLKLALMELQR